jgi:hypothetical protein
MRAVSLVVLAWLLAAGAAHGHEVRPAYLELREGPVGGRGVPSYDAVFKVPARGARRLGLRVRLPEDCRTEAGHASLAGGAHTQRWRAICERGLVGRSIAIEGLAATRTDALARFEREDGTSQTVRLTPERSRFTVAHRAGPLLVARTYVALGIEHILCGFDHLCFVLALLFLVRGGSRLLGAVTAFTVAHSVTLGAATLGWVALPQAPVEAAIALSIVLVAAEVAGRRRGSSLSRRAPWLVALLFGLVHGLGFAGALRELGLPQHAIPVALAAFNVGVELGQLAFVGSVLALLRLACAPVARSGGRIRLGAWDVADLVSTPAAYAIGCVAAFWLIERTAGFFAT